MTHHTPPPDSWREITTESVGRARRYEGRDRVQLRNAVLSEIQDLETRFMKYKRFHGVDLAEVSEHVQDDLLAQIEQGFGKLYAWGEQAAGRIPGLVRLKYLARAMRVKHRDSSRARRLREQSGKISGAVVDATLQRLANESQITRLLRMLPIREQEAVKNRFINMMSYEDMAALRGTSPEHQRNLVSNGIKLLRAMRRKGDTEHRGA